MHASKIKMLFNLPLIVFVLTIKIFCNVKTLIMLMLFLEQARGFCLEQHLSNRKTTRNVRNLVAMPSGYTYARGQPAWSLQATWCPWAPHW